MFEDDLLQLIDGFLTNKHDHSMIRHRQFLGAHMERLRDECTCPQAKADPPKKVLWRVETFNGDMSAAFMALPLHIYIYMAHERRAKRPPTILYLPAKTVRCTMCTLVFGRIPRRLESSIYLTIQLIWQPIDTLGMYWYQSSSLERFIRDGRVLRAGK